MAITSFAMLVPLGLMILAIAAIFNRPTRPYGLAVLGVAMLGVLFARVSMHHPQPPTVVAPDPPPLFYDTQPEAYEPLAKRRAPIQPALRQDQLEALWKKITQPKINLDTPPSPKRTYTKEELARAAKTILLAMPPGADPFTQDLLINAAKAVLISARKANVAQPAAEVDAGAMPAEEPPVSVIHVDAAKPAWLVTTPRLVGNTRRIVVSTDPYSSIEECHAALRRELGAAVEDRVDELAAAANGGRPAHSAGLNSMGISIEYILSELCTEDDYIETVQSSVGAMKRAHALLEFTEAQDRFLMDRWRTVARRDSIHVVGVMSALAVVGLAFVYGLLKLDTWTRGYYTKRLFLGVPAAIIAVLAVATLLGA